MFLELSDINLGSTMGVHFVFNIVLHLLPISTLNLQHSQPTSPSSYSTPQSSTWLEQPKAETLTRERALFLNQGFKPRDFYFRSTPDQIQCEITSMLEKMRQDRMSPNSFMWSQFKRKTIPPRWKTMHMVHVESWELS